MCRDDLSGFYEKSCSWVEVFLGILKAVGYSVIFSCRMGNGLCGKSYYVAAANVAWFVSSTCNMGIELKARMGRCIRIAHPYAIFIGENLTFGDNCAAMDCVAACGNRAKIGVNGVVLKIVPDYALAVGVPAAIVKARGA